MESTEEFVQRCHARYREEGVEYTFGKPFEDAHHPRPKCLGGVETKDLVHDDHMRHGLLQSAELDYPCFYHKTTRDWLYGAGFLCEGWFDLLEVYENYSTWAAYTNDQGDSRLFPAEGVPEGWYGATKGMQRYRCPVTNEIGLFATGTEPEGWQPLYKGTTLYKCSMTGKVAQFVVGEQPEGWVGIRTGQAPYMDPVSGEVRLFAVGQQPEGWVGNASKKTSYKCERTGEVCQFLVGQQPEGWVHIFTGTSNYRSPETGVIKKYIVGQQPDGWVGMRKGISGLGKPVHVRFPNGRIGCFDSRKMANLYFGMLGSGVSDYLDRGPLKKGRFAGYEFSNSVFT